MMNHSSPSLSRSTCIRHQNNMMNFLERRNGIRFFCYSFPIPQLNMTQSHLSFFFPFQNLSTYSLFRVYRSLIGFSPIHYHRQVNTNRCERAFSECKHTRIQSFISISNLYTILFLLFFFSFSSYRFVSLLFPFSTMLTNEKKIVRLQILSFRLSL